MRIDRKSFQEEELLLLLQQDSCKVNRVRSDYIRSFAGKFAENVGFRCDLFWIWPVSHRKSRTKFGVNLSQKGSRSEVEKKNRVCESEKVLILENGQFDGFQSG